MLIPYECNSCPGKQSYGNCPACLQCGIYNKALEEKEYKEYLRLRDKFGEYAEYLRLQQKYETRNKMTSNYK